MRAGKVIAGLVAAGCILGFAGAVEAAPVNTRERNQKQRIVDGVKSGGLTAKETAFLVAEQARIRAEEFRYRRNDGVLGPWERMDLQRDLNRADRRIRIQKNDSQDRK